LAMIDLKKIFTLSFFGISVVLSACGSENHLREPALELSERKSFERLSNSNNIEEMLKLFDYRPQHDLTPLELLKDKKNYQIYSSKIVGTDPVDGSDLEISFLYYKPKTIEPAPLIIIVPAIDGLSGLEKKTAKKLVRRNFGVFIVLLTETITDPSRPLKEINHFLIKSTVGIRMLVDLSETISDIDANKIGICSVSAGGILSSLALGVELRIKSGIFFVAGGNLPDLLTDSTQKDVKKYRMARMSAEGIESEKEFRIRLKSIIKVDPVLFAHRRDPSDIYMFISRNDKSVPSQNQFELWEAFGKPKFKLLKGGHLFGALNLYFRLNSVYEFYLKVFTRGQ